MQPPGGPTSKIPGKAVLAVLVAAALIVATIYAWRGEEDDDGGGGDGGWDTPFDDEFGNVRVTVDWSGPSDRNTNEPYIAIDPTDPLHMVAGGNDYSTFRGDVWVGYYWTFDGGKSWNRSMIPGWDGDISPNGILSPLRPYSLTGGCGDPVVAFGPGGEVYMAGIAFQRTMVGPNNIWVARSDDGGVTFPATQIFTDIVIGEGAIVFNDKEWIAVDPDSGDVYVTWSLFTGLSTAQIAFTKSTNGGQTWSEYKFLSETLNMEIGVQGSQVDVDDDGNVHVSWVDFDTGKLRYTRSDDGGSSFSAPIDVCEVQPIAYAPNNGTYRTPTLPSMKVDRSGTESDGTIYVTWNDQRDSGADVYMVVSRDNGRTWEDEFRVNQDTASVERDQFFPTLTIAPDGKVIVAYYDRREDPHNTLLDMYMSASSDGGRNFTDFRITTASFDGNAGGGSPLGSLTNGSAFIGDYIGACSNEEHAYAIWCDTRNGDASQPDSRDSDLYVARMVLERLDAD